MINEFYVTGDCHGVFTRFKNLPEFNTQKTIGIIVLGDFGVNFFLNKTDDKKKKELGINYPNFIFYCVRGNHEARPQDILGMLEVFDPEVNGYVYLQSEYPHIRYFKDYGIYNIDGYTVGVIGGAYSVDKWYRLGCFEIQDKLDLDYTNAKKTGWFYNEQLSSEEMEDASRLFSGKKIDFIMSHTCPYAWRPVDMFLPLVDQSTVDNSMELWLDELKDQCEWNIWIWGHYHDDRLERPHCEMFFNAIEELPIIYNRWKEYDRTGYIDWWLKKSPAFYQNI